MLLHNSTCEFNSNSLYYVHFLIRREWWKKQTARRIGTCGPDDRNVLEHT